VELQMTDNHAIPEFDRLLARYLDQGQFELAVQEISQAIEGAAPSKREEELCHLYGHLAGAYFIQDDLEKMRAVLEECEATLPDSVLAKFLSLEKRFWFLKDYEGAIEKAEAVVEMVEMHLAYYNRALYLKGLAHAHLGEVREAAQMLHRTTYYDLQLVRMLIDHGVSLAECRDFLTRALTDVRERYTNEAEREVEEKIDEIQALLRQVGE
jgi:tetratricopeptide (TPR) repeat protein